MFWSLLNAIADGPAITETDQHREGPTPDQPTPTTSALKHPDTNMRRHHFPAILQEQPHGHAYSSASRACLPDGAAGHRRHRHASRPQLTRATTQPHAKQPPCTTLARDVSTSDGDEASVWRGRGTGCQRELFLRRCRGLGVARAPLAPDTGDRHQMTTTERLAGERTEDRSIVVTF